jgi:hypothetical protein
MVWTGGGDALVVPSWLKSMSDGQKVTETKTVANGLRMLSSAVLVD